ncbi:MAG: hypothetical protein AAGA77_19800 [Bacteroidota bacterium]
MIFSIKVKELYLNKAIVQLVLKNGRVKGLKKEIAGNFMPAIIEKA